MRIKQKLSNLFELQNVICQLQDLKVFPQLSILKEATLLDAS